MKLKLTIYALFFLTSLAFFNTASAATEFISIIDPDNGAGTDYTYLALWEYYVNSDLTSSATQVFGGEKTGTIADATPVYLCRNGIYQSHYGTLNHASATQALVTSITGSATETSGDVWYTNNTCDSANYFTISDGGDSAIAVAKCRSSNGSAENTPVAVTISGWTTSATNYIKIYTDASAGDRHSGKWDD
ncbi:MAG: hypothetical protein WCZ08_04365, partial [Parcubacteria group bacterium]